eukprot:contig_35596_g8523
MGRRKSAADAKARAAAGSAPRKSAIGLSDAVNLAAVHQSGKAVATLKTYARYVRGKRGWVEWTAAQGVPVVGLDKDAAERVAQNYFSRTDCHTLGEDLGGQIIAEISAYYHEQTSCSRDRWVVLERDGVTHTSGNPANSTFVDDAKSTHAKTRARNGEAAQDSVDVLDPIHIRAFFDIYVPGRSLGECDPEAIMLHAALLMGMSFLLRFNELTRLHTDHLVWSERFPKFSIDEPTKANLAQSSCDLMPWPTTLRLDPR